MRLPLQKLNGKFEYKFNHLYDILSAEASGGKKLNKLQKQSILSGWRNYIIDVSVKFINYCNLILGS